MSILHFISGLPRSGASLISDVLKQNPILHVNGYSALAQLIHNINPMWDSLHVNLKTNNQSKTGFLSALLAGYYARIEKPFIFDCNLQWISLLPILENVLNTKVKMLVCVRNPAEILSSYEKIRKLNPLITTDADIALNIQSNIPERSFFYSGPKGKLGLAHRFIQDAIVMGYLDRLLFVDYNRYCNSPRSQTKRIYDFFELRYFEHDFENIEKVNPLDWSITKMPISKTTVNCVEYLGLDLYEQYNRQIFWNAWV